MTGRGEPSGEPSGGSGVRRRAVALLAAAAVQAGLVGALYLLLVRTPGGQYVDQSGLAGAAWARPYHNLLDPLLDAAAAGAVLVLALAAAHVLFQQGRYVPVLTAAAVVLGADATTQVLKKGVLSRPPYPVRMADHVVYAAHGNTLPSGHTTLAASLAVAAVLLAPIALRPALAVLGTVYAVAMGVGTVLAAWHRPGDVLAAYAVVGAWWALCAGVLLLRRSGHPAGDPRPRGRTYGDPPSMALLGGLAVVACAAAAVLYAVTARTPAAAMGPAHRHLAFLAGAVAAVGLCAAVMALVLATTHRVDP